MNANEIMIKPREYFFREYHPEQPDARRQNAKKKEPYVTLQRWRGILHLNLRTYELLGEPEAVVLAFDKRRAAVGIRAARIDEPHAIRVRSAVTAGLNKSYKVTAFRFCERYASFGFDLTRTWVFPCSMRHGWIVFEVAKGLARN